MEIELEDEYVKVVVQKKQSISDLAAKECAAALLLKE